MSRKAASVGPVKAADAERPEVECVGRALAGVAWPKPSRKLDVTIEMTVAPGAKKKARMSTEEDEASSRSGSSKDRERRDRETQRWAYEPRQLRRVRHPR